MPLDQGRDKRQLQILNMQQEHSFYKLKIPVSVQQVPRAGLLGVERKAGSSRTGVAPQLEKADWSCEVGGETPAWALMARASRALC